MKSPHIRSLQAARTFVLKAKICGIFSHDEGRMACLWDAVDLPEHQPGEKGWGQKITAVWTWKNELPARTQFDKALLELQTTLNIARRNSLTDKRDTWVLFSEQHLEVVRDAETQIEGQGGKRYRGQESLQIFLSAACQMGAITKACRHD